MSRFFFELYSLGLQWNEICTLIGTTGVLHAVNDYRMASKGSMHPLFLVATDWRIRALRMVPSLEGAEVCCLKAISHLSVGARFEDEHLKFQAVCISHWLAYVILDCYCS
jgi:hypothetical protein